MVTDPTSAVHTPAPAQHAPPRGLAGWLAGRVMLHRPAHRARTRWAVSLLAPEPHEDVLDIGFGPGYSLELLAAQVTHGRIVGIDRSPLMVNMARRRLRAPLRSRRMTLVCAAVEDIPRFDVAFEKVLAIDVLECLAEPLRVLSMLRERMAPNGRIAILVQPRARGAAAPGPQQVGAGIAAMLEAAGFAHPEAHYGVRVARAACVCVTARQPVP